MAEYFLTWFLQEVNICKVYKYGIKEGHDSFRLREALICSACFFNIVTGLSVRPERHLGMIDCQDCSFYYNSTFIRMKPDVLEIFVFCFKHLLSSSNISFQIKKYCFNFWAFYSQGNFTRCLSMRDPVAPPFIEEEEEDHPQDIKMILPK